MNQSLCNTDAVGEDANLDAAKNPWLTRLLRARICGKHPFGAYLRLNRALWKCLPPSVILSGPIRWYGNFMLHLVRSNDIRGQAHGTFFLRNRPQLELIRRLVDKIPRNDQMRVAILGCSTGPEAYSVAWSIRSARPDLTLLMTAADIAQRAVETAKLGAYTIQRAGLAGVAVCERLTPLEMDEFFDRKENVVTVKPWLKQGIDWRVADATDRNIVDSIGSQDLVVANNFLCHMDPPESESCLRNIARVVKPGGYLVVSGIDLDVRAKVARDSGWKPVEELLEEIHDGDPVLRNDWPFRYFGLEPLDKTKVDWKFRYATAFQIPNEREDMPPSR